MLRSSAGTLPAGAPSWPSPNIRRESPVRLALLAPLLLALNSCTLSPSLQPVSPKEWRETLAKHRGQIVVVLIWASWCGPCVDLFPALKELSASYKDRGVGFSALSLDDLRRSEEWAAAKQIIVEQNVPIPHYILQQDIASALELLGLTDLPVVRVYNREGELRHQLEPDPVTDALSIIDLQDAIDSLL